jgi:hypothetical protein
MRRQLGAPLHFCGWDIPAGRSPSPRSISNRSSAREDRTADQHDVFTIGTWLSSANRDATLVFFPKPTDSV